MKREPKFTSEEVDMIFDLYVRQKSDTRHTALSVRRDVVAVRNLLFNRGWLRHARDNREIVAKPSYAGKSPGPADLAEVNSKIILVGNFTSERVLQYVEWFGASRVVLPHEIAP